MGWHILLLKTSLLQLECHSHFETGLTLEEVQQFAEGFHRGSAAYAEEFLVRVEGREGSMETGSGICVFFHEETRGRQGKTNEWHSRMMNTTQPN